MKKAYFWIFIFFDKFSGLYKDLRPRMGFTGQTWQLRALIGKVFLDALLTFDVSMVVAGPLALVVLYLEGDLGAGFCTWCPISRLYSMKIWYSKMHFHLLFHWRGIYYGQIHHKTFFEIAIWPQKSQKIAKNVDFWKMEHFGFGYFSPPKLVLKPIMMYLCNIHFIYMAPIPFGIFLQIIQKWSLFG